MPQVYMPAKQLIDMAAKTKPQFKDGKIIFHLRESKQAEITLVGFISETGVVDFKATLIEQHYSGDDQLSNIATDDAEITSYLNNLTTSDKA